MTTDATPNPKVLDLGALLAGIELPTDTVDVYMNAAISYALGKNRTEAKKSGSTKELEKEYRELVEAGLKSRLTFHLQAVPKGILSSLINKAYEKFPKDYNFMGGVIQEPERDDFHANLRWAAHITKMVGPNGEEAPAPTPEQVAQFRDQAPKAAVDAVENAIVALEESARTGFETLAQEHSFL